MENYMKKVITHHFLILILTMLALQTSFAQRTVKMNLETMIEKAGMIVHGTVAKVETGADPETKIISTFVTINVKEDFYGAKEQQITLKMVGGKTAKRTIRFSEMPKFVVGEEIISLFLPPSKYGFTSPVGMGQGKFSIQTDVKTDKQTVRNASRNSNLFSGVKNSSALAKKEWIQHSNENIELAELSQTIRSFVTILKK